MADDNSNFSFEKYQIPTITGTGENGKELLTSYVDITDSYANNGFVVSFFHVPSGKSVYFKAFITAFNETYNSDWAAETVYGRADPIYMFKNTQRKISLALKIPAGTAGEAYENLAKVQTLVQFLYPTYTDVSNANTISQSPLVRLKVMNLLSAEAVYKISDENDSETSGDVVQRSSISFEDDASAFYEEYASTNNATLGLLGVINNLTVNHNIDNPDYGVIEKAANTILPKLIEINLDFGCIHEHTVGWKDGGDGTSTFANEFFPYGAPEFETGNAEAANAGAANWSDTAHVTTEDSAFYSAAQKAAEATAEQEASDQAAMDAAEARYSGLLGGLRQKQDAAAVGPEGTGGTDYQQQAQKGASMISVNGNIYYDADE